MKITTEDGKEWNVKGYRHPKDGERYVFGDGSVSMAQYDATLTVLIVEPVTKRHGPFGTLWFEETGEATDPSAHYTSRIWYLVDGRPKYTEAPTGNFPILRPVAVES
jgi:hypothetical protein